MRSSPRIQISLLTLAFAAISAAAGNSPSDYADPFVGTDGHGHAFPGATVPFGMVQLSPDTRTDTWDGCSGYHYSDTKILGFSHDHLAGTGCGCLGDIMLMPTSGSVKLAEAQYSSSFSHKKESAKPGYYQVFLEDPKVNVELSATSRAGYHHYSYTQAGPSHVVLDLNHGVQNDTKDTYLRIENPTTVSGYRTSSGWGGERKVYFVVKFSRPMTGVTIQKDGARMPANATEAQGKVVASFDFDTASNHDVDAKVGISATGVEGARKNLDKEIPGWGLAGVRAKATKSWNDALGRIAITTPDVKVRRTFYSNMYLSFLAPNLFNDADGSYFGSDRQVHAGAKFDNYSTFSLWDTYRALHPLMTLTQPERVSGMVNALVAGYRESKIGMLPIWPLFGNETYCMIGNHAVPVIVDAYMKGIRGFDAEEAYQAMKTSVMRDSSGMNTYKRLGYVASRPGDAATSKTLEYSVDDWCLAEMANALGHKDDAAFFLARSANYRNVFDGSTRFFRGRKANGTWRRPFDTIGLVGDEYTEADAWQYGFAAQQDVPGMIDLYGGDKGFTEKLDALFAADSTIHTTIPDITGRIGQYAQGNEMCHHIAYLYAMAGQPWKTQKIVRNVMATLFDDTPAGQCGNTDCGQMAAWYVLSAAGFYPVNPANGVYVLGSPAVDKATFNVAGKPFSVIAENNSPTNVYVQSVELNGKPYDKTWITHQQVAAGGTLKFVMGSSPKPSWGSSLASRPLPTMPNGFQYAALPKPADDSPITLSLPIRISAGDVEAGNFIVDPNMIDGMSAGSDAQVDTSAPNAAPAAVYSAERYGQDFTYKFPVPAGKYTVRLHFAEIFDEGVGMRVADYSINGKKVLSNFDIYAEAGNKTKKAVVREFKGIVPNADGTITIRTQATPTSPDQNAKISGLEIIKEN